MAKRPPEWLNPSADFEHARDSGRQAAGAGRQAPMATAWSELIAGKTVGKRANLFYPGGENAFEASVDLLTVMGDDRNALQLTLTLGSPKFIPIAVAPANLQNATGERDNTEILTGGVAWTKVFANVQWGVGGVSHSADIDFINGACLNLQASWVRVRAFISTFDETAGIYVVAANVGPGWAKPNNAQKTVRVPDLGNGALSGVFPIPRFAKQAILSGTGLGNPTWSARLEFCKDTGGVNVISESNFSNLLRSPTLVPAGAYYFKVQNESVFTVSVYPVFDLTV